MSYGTSNTFTANAGIFGKVYFPRVIMPLKTVISNLFKFGIQLLILIIFYFYFLFNGSEISPNANLLLFPVYVLMMALLGLGAGMTISALTTKYRDLTVLVGFATTLINVYLGGALSFKRSFRKNARLGLAGKI